MQMPIIVALSCVARSPDHDSCDTGTASRQKGPIASLKKILELFLHICTRLQMDSISPASSAHSSISGFNSVTTMAVPVWMSKMDIKRSELQRATSISFCWKGNKTKNVLGECLLCSIELLVCPNFWGEAVLEMRYPLHITATVAGRLLQHRGSKCEVLTAGFHLKEIMAHL